MATQLVTLGKSVRTWDVRYRRMHPWRLMHPEELALLRYVERQPIAKFVSFRDVQVLPGVVVGVVMANGVRRLCAFGGPYGGSRFQNSVALGWMVLDGMDVERIGDSPVSVALG
ncbi:hypothetical protein SAMN05421819_3551 [Bryocella elongata]|uniref:Uncharacterized protein n=1 Tax=Bryocella elongata TaxID=863522 RepID=A0A1H6B5R5_9BACT|nr:hypothetical protein [Bryocella elongata]SEG56191.1 hypothetical protein SAMN05421819_3551 [Bryocella elongata]